MDKRNTAYFITAAVFSLGYTFSAIMDLFSVGPAHVTLAHLGYPAYVATILGVWKAGAVVTILAPGLPRLKEWAYAGVVFDLTGGFASHLFNGDKLPMPVVPILFLAVAMTSYVLRPASRRLAAAPEASAARVAHA